MKFSLIIVGCLFSVSAWSQVILKSEAQQKAKEAAESFGTMVTMQGYSAWLPARNQYLAITPFKENMEETVGGLDRSSMGLIKTTQDRLEVIVVVDKVNITSISPRQDKEIQISFADQATARNFAEKIRNRNTLIVMNENKIRINSLGNQMHISQQDVILLNYLTGEVL